MEVDLHDITGDIMEFFKGVIEDTGEHYEKQEQIYKKYNGGKVKSIMKEQPSSELVEGEENRYNQDQPKPEMSDIVSFTVLVELLQKHKRNYDYCLELK